jgi:hypothetical protein
LESRLSGPVGWVCPLGSINPRSPTRSDRPPKSASWRGKSRPAVRGMIIRVSDKVRAGEISLFEFDQEEAEAAKARLDSQRKKWRERYARNKEQINAKRRGICP